MDIIIIIWLLSSFALYMSYVKKDKRKIKREEHIEVMLIALLWPIIGFIKVLEIFSQI